MKSKFENKSFVNYIRVCEIMWKNHIAFQKKSNLIGGQMKYQGFKQYHIEMYVATCLNYNAPKEILNNW